MVLTSAVGYLAASLVFATFCAKRMVPLRTLAIGSNIAFIGYGYLDGLWPILILHFALLPMNICRLQQALLLERVTGAFGPRQRNGDEPAAVWNVTNTR
jgi:CRP/FNR family transcriptional regulator, cyclic AMP receptor protein